MDDLKQEDDKTYNLFISTDLYIVADLHANDAWNSRICGFRAP